VLAVNPNPENGIVDIYDYGVSLSGPVIRNKLWFTTTGKLNPLREQRLGSYEPDGSQMIGNNRMRNDSFKLSWQATGDSQLHFTHNWNRKGEMNFLPGSETGSVFGEVRATQARDQQIKITQVKYTSVLSSRAVLDVAGSYHYGPYPVLPNPEVRPGDIPRFDITTSTSTVVAANYTNNHPLKPVFISSLTYTAGRHEVKFGYQYNGNDYRSDSYSMSHHPAGLVARFRSGVPDSVQTYNTPVTVQNYTSENGVYVQDRWRPTRKMTVNVGLRLEKVETWFPDQCQEATPFIAAQCFTGGHTPGWLDLAPRFGMIYDVTGDGRTALKFSANRYWPAIGVGLPGNVNPNRLTNDTRLWSDRNNDLIPQLDELGPSTGFNLGTTNHYNPDLKRPYSNEFNVEVERQIKGNIGSASGTSTVSGAGTSDAATSPFRRKAVTVFNQSAALRSRFDVLFNNAPENDTTYNGVDFTFNKRFADRWMVMGGLTLSRNEGRQDQNADLNDPNMQFSEGLFQNDVPVAFKMSAIYDFPFAIKMSANVQHFTGFPEDTTVLVTSATVPLTQVSQSIRIEPRGTTRLPNLNMVDFSVRKAVRLGEYTAEPSVDLFNAFNAAPIQLRITQLGPTYGRPSSVLGGRMIRFGLNLSF
jgi:hypothetical protein